jgi:hypothetical protein
MRPGVSRSTMPVACVIRYTTKSSPPYDKINQLAEAKAAKKALQAHPDQVSTESSVRHVFETSQNHEQDADMLGSVKSDIATVKDTFALKEVPRDALILGATGLLPYLGTSLSTVYLAYDINHAAATGEGYLFQPETARDFLNYIEPIQIGYGAVVSEDSCCWA